MKKYTLRWISLLLAFALLLAGCGASEPEVNLRGDILSRLEAAKRLSDSDGSGRIDSLPAADEYWQMTPFSEMVYARPSTQDAQAILDEIEVLIDQDDKNGLIAAADRFYDWLADYYTAYFLSNIYTSADLTDKYWEEENSFCLNIEPEVNSLMESMHEMLAGARCRKALEEEYFGDGFFDAYDEDSFWDDEMIELSQKESELISRYYAQQDTRYTIGTPAFYFHCADDMAQTLVELIQVRKQIAARAGYSSYSEYAGAAFFSRDFSTEEVDRLVAEIREELVPLYRKYSSLSGSSDPCDDAQMLRYLESVVSNLGDAPLDAFRLMQQAGLYDIRYSPNKYNSSFEVYLDSYQEPFLFLNPIQTRYDCLTLCHEFGHFCRDYASWGTPTSIDVQEFFSQAMEYLALYYGEDADDLVTVKLADSLCTYVEQACYASFEQQMYALPDDQLTVEGLYALYDQVNRDFGFSPSDYDRREFITITHFYTSPLYIISYIISNDAAMQIYELEQASAGSGFRKFLEVLGSEEYSFLSFVKSAKLESPFKAGRIREVREFFEEAF